MGTSGYPDKAVDVPIPVEERPPSDAPPRPEVSDHPFAEEYRCPRCQARLSPETVSCGFCGLILGPEVAGRPQVTGRGGSKVALLGGIAWIVTATGFSVWHLSETCPAPSDEEECAENLRDHFEAILRLQRAGEAIPRATGRAFWDLVREREHVGTPPGCSAARRHGGGTSTYRGPARPFEELPDTGVLACDREGIHPTDARILFKNGTVISVPRGSPEYARALRETAD